ncbi:hypothetical protein Fot_30238 [Forsythia ovata]|uniref:Uncharacterized protein n=1 Tax=Forsythia ovata TaxID=205694 RepID=A0ABD1TU58_9LAMI
MERDLHKKLANMKQALFDQSVLPERREITVLLGIRLANRKLYSQRALSEHSVKVYINLALDIAWHPVTMELSFGPVSAEQLNPLQPKDAPLHHRMSVTKKDRNMG